MLVNQFDKFHEEFCQCNWSLCPVDIQKTYVVALLNTQEAPNIRGFGSAICTREVFMQVALYSDFL